MSDQCKHCILRGDIKACEAFECYQRESWYVCELQNILTSKREEIASLKKTMKTMQEATKFYARPSPTVSLHMLEQAKAVDEGHFVCNLNAMMTNGYCLSCGLTPSGCAREGCGKIAVFA